jgi:hypothetical protein
MRGFRGNGFDFLLRLLHARLILCGAASGLRPSAVFLGELLTPTILPCLFSNSPSRQGPLEAAGVEKFLRGTFCATKFLFFLNFGVDE